MERWTAWVTGGQWIEQMHQASIAFRMSVPIGENGEKKGVLALIADRVCKTAFIVDGKMVEFELPDGTVSKWIHDWWLLNRTPYILVGDGRSESMGIYSFRGKQASLTFDSLLGTPETVCAFMRDRIAKVGGTGFIYDVQVRSLIDVMPFNRD